MIKVVLIDEAQQTYLQEINIMQRTCFLSDNEGKIILEELDFKFNTYNNLHTFKNLCEKLNRKSNLFSFRFEYLQNKSFKPSLLILRRALMSYN